MPRYVKKPIVIDAFQFDPIIWHHAEQCKIDGVDPKVMPGYLEIQKTDEGAFFIETLEGDMTVRESDFVIKGIQGEYYPCKADIFYNSYEPWVDEE